MKISVATFKKNPVKWIKLASSGEVITITKDGMPVAYLSPMPKWGSHTVVREGVRGPCQIAPEPGPEA